MKKAALESPANALRATRGQIFLALLTLIVLVGMTISTFNGSNVSAKHGEILDAAETSSVSIILAQREALEYIVEIDQWISGNLPRRAVEQSRILLAKRLHTFNSSGTPISSLVNPRFLQDLKSADAMIEKTSPGLLPVRFRGTIKAEMAPILEDIANYAAELVISFQKSVEVQLREVTEQRAKITTRNLVLRYLLLLMTLFLFFWVGRTFSARYRSIQASIETQVDDLAASRARLEAAQAVVAELRILDEEKNEFISNINHEIRTPLTSIVGYLGLVGDLTDEESNPQTAKFLQIVDRNLVLLLDLVENMLTISKLEIGASSRTNDRVILNEVIADTIFILQPSLDAAEITIEFNMDNSLDDWSIAGIKGQISQVFLNLIENSLKFSPRNSNMQIDMTAVLDAYGAKFVRVSVADHGIGIPADDIKKLSDRFFRSENAIIAQIPGTGLGLAIVKKIVQQHGGQINIESEINVGTTVRIDLPTFVSRIDQLVLERRLPVLERAIDSIATAPVDQLRIVAHEMGGAISFYTFIAEGEELINFSRWIAAAPDLPEDEIVAKRDEILILLRTALLKIELGMAN